jgi:hypothetical protein
MTEASMKKYSPSDVLCALFYYAGEGHTRTGLVTDEVKIHQALYEVQKKLKLNLLDFFKFRKYRTYHSRDVEASLSILRISQVLGSYEEARSKVKEYYEITSTGKKYIENEILQKFTEGEIRDLKKITKTMKEKVDTLAAI